MVAIARSSPRTPIQQILLITAKHFEIRVLPDLQLALPKSEFIDQLRFRWSEKPSPFPRQPPLTDSTARLSGGRAV